MFLGSAQTRPRRWQERKRGSFPGQKDNPCHCVKGKRLYFRLKNRRKSPPASMPPDSVPAPGNALEISLLKQWVIGTFVSLYIDLLPICIEGLASWCFPSLIGGLLLLFMTVFPSLAAGLSASSMHVPYGNCSLQRGSGGRDGQGGRSSRQPSGHR